MQKLRITIENRVYEVLVEVLEADAASSRAATPAAAVAAASPESPAPLLPRSAPSAPPPAAPGDVNSPLAGKVVSVDVQPGQAVEAGAQLVTLEAMKMNTYVYAPRAGRVDAILVRPGDGVEEGAVLLRFQ